MSKPKGIKRLIFILAGLCLSFFSPHLSAQEESYADELRRNLSRPAHDTLEVFYLNELAWELKFDAPDSSRMLLRRSIDLADKLDYQKGKADALNYFGVTEDIAGNSRDAVSYLKRALQIRKEINDRPGQASIYANLGNIYESLEDYGEAAAALRLAIRLNKDLKDKKKELRAVYALGILYESMGNYEDAMEQMRLYLEETFTGGDPTEVANAQNVTGNILTELDRFAEALEYYRKAEKTHTKLKNERELATVLSNIGYVYDALAELAFKRENFAEADSLFGQAENYLQRTYEMNIALQDDEGVAQVLNNFGTLYKNKGEYLKLTDDENGAAEAWETAMRYALKAKKNREKAADKKGLLDVYNTIGDILRRQGKITEALRYAQLCLETAEEIQDDKLRQNAYKDLARAHYALGNFKIAYEYRETYDTIKYRRLNQESIDRDKMRTANHNSRISLLNSENKLLLKEQEINRQKAKLARESLFRNTAVIGAIALALLAFLLFNRNRIKSRANADLQQKNAVIAAEKQRSESLLLNILPAATAAELKADGKARARHYDSVTVMFTDFKNFTGIAEQLSPEQLVAELDRYFGAFDDIITRRNLEKIKTIGDAYMCAGGLPVANTTHPQEVVNAALEIRDFMTKSAAEKRAAGQPVFELRIGIHTGAVTAGVVGSKKFAYDIWGDAVNVASRMEMSGEVGKINISRQTYELVKKDFVCVSRGKIEAKNKGEIEMYFVERPEKRL